MKKNIYITSAVCLLAGATLLSSCSDEFLKEKKLYGKYSETTVYSNYETAQNRIDYLYWQLLPGTKEGDNMYANIVSTGDDDDDAKTTEEYGGISKWEDNTKPLDYQSLNGWNDHFYVEFKENSPYGNIRNINDAIEGIEASADLTEKQKNELLGQAYFMRAWRYYTMVRWYGGVPIIKNVQDALVGDGGGENLIVPRSTTKECIDFICEDLDKASAMLPKSWDQASKNWGRVTSGTAAALKGRVLLLFASPIFNRSDNHERWEAAYQANKAALDTLAMGGYGLAYENNPGDESTSGANWAKIFLNPQGSDGVVNEAVFVTLYNNLQKQEDKSDKNNPWEQSIRPKTAAGDGGKAATSEIVDLFPMADGKKPGESQYEYDPNLFFANRDPRFYRTFAFPGVKWTYDGNTKDLLTDDKTTVFHYKNIDITDNYPYNGSDYVLWSYTWYDNLENTSNPAKSGWAADALGNRNFSVYVRKRSDDLELNANPLYKYTNEGEQPSFKHSGAPYIEMRYAEVLLNYAEAAAATNRFDEAFNALKRIRSRVYNPASNPKIDANYGLTLGDRAHMLAEVLYERQIELAYEGKRFEDMRRWMLFDGGEGQGALKSSWALTGFGGNTCTYLGVAPANGHKNHYIEMFTNKKAAKSDDNGSDPLLKEGVTRPAGLNLMNRFAKGNNGEDVLEKFYTDYLTRKDRNADGNNDAQVPTFQPNYYFLGLNYSAMYNNATLMQTIGWDDYSHGGMGTYDPLEEDPSKLLVDNSYKK